MLNSLSFPEKTPHLVIGYEVPEPATLSLIAIGALALVRKRRK